MNSNGIFLTLMVFLVAIVSVSLAISNYNLEKQREVFSAEQTAFSKVNDQFEKLYFEYKDLAAAGANARYHSRLLPFDYEFSGSRTTLKVSQKVPGAPARFSSFYDWLQTTAILWTNPRISTGLLTELDFGGLQSNAWAGGDSSEYPVIEYRILPGCIYYTLDYENDSANKIVRFRKGNIDPPDDCGFGWTDIQKISITVSGQMDIDEADDEAENPPECTGAFNGAPCMQTNFVDDSDDPFVEFNYAGPASSLSTSNFLDSAAQQMPHTVSFYPLGSMPGTPLVLEVNNPNELLKLDLGPNTGLTGFLVETEITMRKPIQSMELQEFELTVKNPVFAIARKTGGN